jgi:oxygen-independent coproporphyrinogen III oxidase
MNELALYLHFPFCRRRCHYCSFVSFAGREADIGQYVHSLADEIRLRRRPQATLRSIYFGGGTPSLLKAAQISSLLATIGTLYPLKPDAEITIEANPGTVSEGSFVGLKQAGVNRISLGVQSLDDGELGLLGRLHTAGEARAAILLARGAGFTNLSLDFIYGIPGRRPDTWHTVLEEAISMGVEHLSLYPLTLEEDSLLGKRVSRGEVPAPDPDQAADEYELAELMLARAGFVHYEISNWAKPGCESRHNLAYWQGIPYLGAGVAAHSFLDGERLANTRSLDGYLAALTAGRLPECEREVIDEGTTLAEAVILGLRLQDGVDISDTERRFKVNLRQRFAREIEELSELGLLAETGGCLKLSPRGRLLGNEVFWRFLP